MSENNIFISRSDLLKMGEFIVFQSSDIEDGEIVDFDETKIIYAGIDSYADMLFGWAIAQKVINEGNQVIFTFNSGEDVVMGGNNEC